MRENQISRNFRTTRQLWAPPFRCVLNSLISPRKSWKLLSCSSRARRIIILSRNDRNLLTPTFVRSPSVVIYILFRTQKRCDVVAPAINRVRPVPAMSDDNVVRFTRFRKLHAPCLLLFFFFYCCYRVPLFNVFVWPR